MSAVGSLCSGYGGLDMAAEAVTGGTTTWHCEFDAAPSALLAHHHPDVPNFGDLKALEWADHPVDVLTAGYPCQPFSGAGKRLGTDDPRHLFPWIAQGVERMRPPLLLLENVRGHLSLGFDVVLAELDRIGYDARWTLLRAADVGAPHGRSRLWIAARAREVGGWPAPSGEPTALAEDGGWADPASGLFGSIPAQRPGTAGVMVGGLRWDGSVSEPRGREVLLATPDTAPEAPNGGSNQTRHPAGLGNQVQSLLPTPNAAKAGSDMTLTCSGDGRETPNKLGWAVALLPTPVSDNSRGLPQSGTDYASLPNIVCSLLPTPAVNDMGAGKTVEAWDEWTAAQKAKHGNGNGHGPSLSIEAARLAQEAAWTPSPTPSGGHTSSDGPASTTARTTSATTPRLARRPSTTATSAVETLLPTPSVADVTGGRKGRSGDRSGELLLNGIAHANTWGPYAAAIARWEALTRPAPPPTEPGRNGPRLSPAFVEWMMGLPVGWVVDVPGVTRNNALKMLGNGVVPAQAAAAFALLGVADALPKQVAA